MGSNFFEKVISRLNIFINTLNALQNRINFIRMEQIINSNF
jgi:hypothetical protein